MGVSLWRQGVRQEEEKEAAEICTVCMFNFSFKRKTEGAWGAMGNSVLRANNFG